MLCLGCLQWKQAIQGSSLILIFSWNSNSKLFDEEVYCKSNRRQHMTTCPKWTITVVISWLTINIKILWKYLPRIKVSKVLCWTLSRLLHHIIALSEAIFTYYYFISLDIKYTQWFGYCNVLCSCSWIKVSLKAWMML